MSRWQDFINEEELRKALSVLKPDGELFEIRIITSDRKKTISGYFKNADKLISAMNTVDLRDANVYFILNRLKEECYSRIQHDCFRAGVNTSSDTDISDYEFLFVDIDPERAAGISSSKEELEAAKQTESKIYDYLKNLGFSEPIRAMSGNGGHLLYRIDLPNNEDGRNLIERCLTVLSMLFDDGIVKIDTVNANPSRPCKLYGTMAQKGANTSERPHRMSWITQESDQVTDRKCLEVLATELELPEKSKNSYKPHEVFDLLDFMARHKITYSKAGTKADCTIYYLDECPFDGSHRDGDARVFLYNDGSIGFKCHHNSCNGKRWKDVRLKFEPDAYQYHDDGHIEEGYKQRKEQLANNASDQEDTTRKSNYDFPLMPLAPVEDLLSKDIPDPVVYIGDIHTPLLSEGTTVLAAPPKIGKSWFCVHLAAAILTGSDFLGFHTKAAHVQYYDLEQSEGIRKKRIKLALKQLQIEHPKGFYTQEKLQRIGHGFKEQIEYDLKNDPEIGVFIIDVFVNVENARRNTETEYQWTYKNFAPVNDLAKQYHVAIILVLHTRKGHDPDHPFDNILGSTANQGASNHMIVLSKDKYNSEVIHLYAQGRETEGIIELDYANKGGRLVLTDPAKDQPEDLMEFMESEIRDAIVKLMEKTSGWKGKCQGLIDECARLEIGMDATPKQLGAFLSKNSGRFMKHDRIIVENRKDGNAGRTYILRRIDETNDENEDSTIGIIGKWQDIIGPTPFDPA